VGAGGHGVGVYVGVFVTIGEGVTPSGNGVSVGVPAQGVGIPSGQVVGVSHQYGGSVGPGVRVGEGVNPSGQGVGDHQGIHGVGEFSPGIVVGVDHKPGDSHGVGVCVNPPGRVGVCVSLPGPGVGVPGVGVPGVPGVGIPGAGVGVVIGLGCTISSSPFAIKSAAVTSPSSRACLKDILSPSSNVNMIRDERTEDR